ncbi:Gar1-domain-containing protein [Parathielavia appendiculata]|uniref:H/ACA ribonucleoprotein complex subunit n=1 Tax=Parathielavia appendiculata TaxID=2587402 RepID=A0AAN6Z463_9PEZI|nr:Gar1-domain-containing protein [Parathielavia appendiculata]
MGPPTTVLEMGKFVHACEGEMVVESTNPKIPHFNAPIYLENKVRYYNSAIHFYCFRAHEF